MTIAARILRLERVRRARTPVACPNCGNRSVAECMVPPGGAVPPPWCPRCGRRVAWTPVAMPEDLCALMGFKR